jgi:hypothetical protein
VKAFASKELSIVRVGVLYLDVADDHESRDRRRKWSLNSETSQVGCPAGRCRRCRMPAGLARRCGPRSGPP